MTDYKLLTKQALALTEDVPYLTANLANISALIYGELEEINWAGFYILEEDKLVLGPFQGRPACVMIPMGKGVCGTSAMQDIVLQVGNVHEFPGHIACDSASESEIVIPLHRGGKVWGVLDIDSPVRDRFTDNDRLGLEELVKALEENILQ